MSALPAADHQFQIEIERTKQNELLIQQQRLKLEFLQKSLEAGVPAHLIPYMMAPPDTCKTLGQVII
jgi:hypothetical protein